MTYCTQLIYYRVRLCYLRRDFLLEEKGALERRWERARPAFRRGRPLSSPKASNLCCLPERLRSYPANASHRLPDFLPTPSFPRGRPRPASPALARAVAKLATRPAAVPRPHLPSSSRPHPCAEEAFTQKEGAARANGLSAPHRKSYKEIYCDHQARPAPLLPITPIILFRYN